MEGPEIIERYRVEIDELEAMRDFSGANRKRIELHKALRAAGASGDAGMSRYQRERHAQRMKRSGCSVDEIARAMQVSASEVRDLIRGASRR